MSFAAPPPSSSLLPPSDPGFVGEPVRVRDPEQDVLHRTLVHTLCVMSGGSLALFSTDKPRSVVDAAGIDPQKLRYVAFEGGGEPMTALLGGHVQAIGQLGDTGVGHQVVHRSHLRGTARQLGQIFSRGDIAAQPLQLVGVGFQQRFETADAARHRQHPGTALQQGRAQR